MKLNQMCAKLILSLSLVISLTANGQQLVPATSEDEEMFERQLELAEKNAAAKKGLDKSSSKKVDANEFKEFVSSEAKKLKEADVSTRTQMGQNTAAQKRKNSAQGSSTNAGSNGSSAGNKDGRTSAPIFNNSGGAPDSPGKSGNRSKK